MLLNSQLLQHGRFRHDSSCNLSHLSYLITNPRILAKFRTEYESAFISSPITDSEARKLPYHQAIIKEGLKIWPPVVGLMAKEVPPEGDVINGLLVPGGTSIGYGAWG